MFEGFASGLADRLDGAEEGDIRRILDAWQKDIASHEALEESIYQAIVKANLAGQLFVASHEAEEIALAGETSNRFLHMTFPEALEFFLSKRIISPEEYQALLDDARDGAFTAKSLLSDSLRRIAFERIQAAMKGEGDLSDFVSAIRDGEENLGIEPSSDSYLRTVYHTNIGDSYNRGKEKQALSPRVRNSRPYLVRRAITDDRVRPNHAAAHNVAMRNDNPDAHIWMRTWGFSCRCSFVTMTEEQVSQRGYRIIEEIPEDMGPDIGFRP